VGTKKEPVVLGQNEDVIDTLKRGGVKIISSGMGKEFMDLMHSRDIL
jgi:hypothetical protein